MKTRKYTKCWRLLNTLEGPPEFSKQKKEESASHHFEKNEIIGHVTLYFSVFRISSSIFAYHVKNRICEIKVPYLAKIDLEVIENGPQNNFQVEH